MIFVSLTACGGPQDANPVEPALTHAAVDETATEAEPGFLWLDVTGIHVSVKAINVKLERLLSELTSQSGLSFASRNPVQQRVTLQFDELPIEKAIARILSGLHYIVEHTDFVEHATTQQLLSVRVLGPQFEPELDDTLTNLALSDPDKGVRIAAASRIPGKKPTRDTLELVLADQDPSVRMEAVEALVDTGPEAAFALLEHALGDPIDAVRETAVETLGEIGGERALALLETALSDANPLVREEAVYALSLKRSRTAVALLETALTDSDPAVVEAAAHALENRQPL